MATLSASKEAAGAGMGLLDRIARLSLEGGRAGTPSLPPQAGHWISEKGAMPAGQRLEEAIARRSLANVGARQAAESAAGRWLGRALGWPAAAASIMLEPAPTGQTEDAMKREWEASLGKPAQAPQGRLPVYGGTPRTLEDQLVYQVMVGEPVVHEQMTIGPITLEDMAIGQVNRAR